MGTAKVSPGAAVRGGLGGQPGDDFAEKREGERGEEPQNALEGEVREEKRWRCSGRRPDVARGQGLWCLVTDSVQLLPDKQ